MMTLKKTIILIAIIPFMLVPCAYASDGFSQIVMVLTDSWDASNGKLYRMEKSGNQWRFVGRTVPVVIGRKGLGWGNKQLQDEYGAGPLKQEGDKKTPAGMFNLVYAMGYQARAPGELAIPYTQIKDSSICVDDPGSQHYTKIADSIEDGLVQGSWGSAEKMRRKDDLYKWLVVVDYNMSKPVPGAGSCIFMHLWKKSRTGTAGCVAMSESDLINIMRWLDIKYSPRLLVLPESLYDSFRQELHLPKITRQKG